MKVSENVSDVHLVAQAVQVAAYECRLALIGSAIDPRLAPYSQETMNGFEYSAAIHMIMDGLVDEGMTCVAALRKRYDGERRNPWNEFECGSNYARSMAAYALLNAFSGFEFDMVAKRIGFHPVRMTDGRFRCFWSLDSGWGEVEITPGGAELRVLYGKLDLRSLALPIDGDRVVSTVRLGSESVTFAQEEDVLHLSEFITIPAGAMLSVS